ncbi:hemerythrin domain-containing protein [Variovorax sp. YR216]|uniref:hemerythrin domain-containing protein n=1 Tax=Variovorax sp. YR216 TaxID=1882828 RepID=UPI00089A35A7|nr:hemerythrin domain-containing protein [Variovorax sp. YR216]SEB19950.1 hemerythrin-like metal-binding domain protein [Variovorax sp. YR216]
MSYLEWSEALSLDLPTMDDTHRELVELLGAVEDSPDEHLVTRWRVLIDHTEDHFAREDQWMRDTRFSSVNCHTTQHQVVLQVIREGETAYHSGRPEVIRVMARELAKWFLQHTQSMDAALALHLRRVGYDVITGVVSIPNALPAEEIRGCASATCRT